MTGFARGRCPEHAVGTDLREALEAPAVPDAHTPVHTYHRYLSNRLDHLDYRSALATGLPISSRELECVHRYVVRPRIKRPGASWTTNNAETILALRITRANGQWSTYWQDESKQAA